MPFEPMDLAAIGKWFMEDEFGNALLRVLLFVVPVLTLVPGMIWWERRLLSWMQDRIGPNRVGPFGLLQPIADGVKLFLKEDITPKSIDRLIYFFAPALALFPAFTLGGTIPWGPDLRLTPIADVSIGLMYIMAISSLGVYGIVLAGYASNNKYSLMGGLRSSAQLISYELAMGMAIAAMALSAGSLKPTDIVKFQEGAWMGIAGMEWLTNWGILTPVGFVAAIIFGICMIAETNRPPFDLPEAENELIAGYHTEYSSMKFAVFFMGEYAAQFVFSGVFATLFLGGYHILPFQSALPLAQVPFIAPAVFIAKCAGGVTVFIWLRATLPRLRYDQLMALGWKTLLPVGVLNFILAALIIVAEKVNKSPLIGLGAWAGAFVLCYAMWIAIKKTMSRDLHKQLGSRQIKLINEPAQKEAVPEPAISSNA